MSINYHQIHAGWSLALMAVDAVVTIIESIIVIKNPNEVNANNHPASSC
ncbi:hypothetical protein N644_1748 [Lactiplantibacillus paraplantarum]|nr:hypothetical protein N644_1748 [Lactiplantibacillus paraplantarum]